MVPKNYGDFTAKQRREFIAKLAQESIENNAPKFKVKRFKLDDARNRFLKGPNSHEFGSVIKSFWVCNWSGNFVAKIVPNHAYDRDQDSGLPLRKNMAMPFEVPVSDACIEFEAQSGVWIEIAYSDSEDITIGNTEITISGLVSINEGSSVSQSKVTVSSVTGQILAAEETRRIARFQFKSGVGTVYVGTPAELADANFMDICHQVDAGDDFEIKDTAAHSAKAVGGDVVYSLRKGMN